MPDKPGNPCASAFKSDTQRFKCVMRNRFAIMFYESFLLTQLNLLKLNTQLRSAFFVPFNPVQI